jgi:cytochrome c biogenesis protein CcmG/thiol:disulfide interchange protein DsbE
VATVVVALLAVALPACDSSGGTRVNLGQPAPTFSTFDLNGAAVRLADYRGKTVLLNFWASWCVPCRTEFPLLKGVDGKGDVAVLGVIFRDSADRAREFMREQAAPWPGLVDPKGEIAKAYRIGLKPGIPVTYLINRDGIVTKKHIGQIRTESDLTALLRPDH